MKGYDFEIEPSGECTNSRYEIAPHDNISNIGQSKYATAVYGLIKFK